MKSPKPAETPPSDCSKRHFQILTVIGLVWLSLFVLMLIEKAASIRAFLPIVTLLFFGYLIYATVSALKKGRS